MKTNVIGLMTDWGRDDGAFGACQGVIWGINPKVNIADMSQNVESWDIKQGAFLLMAHYQTYPKGTIFAVVIDPGVGTKRKAIVVETVSGYYFVGPDNGVLSWALRKEKIKRAVNVTNRKYFREPVSAVFEGRDIFTPVAAYLSKGVASTKFGEMINPPDMVWADYPLKEEGNRLIGEVLFIDKFGNLITSIERSVFTPFIIWHKGSKVPKGHLLPKKIEPGDFQFKIGSVTIDRLSHTYADGKGGEPLALFGGDFGECLDIAICEGSAAEKLGVEVGEKIIITRR